MKQVDLDSPVRRCLRRAMLATAIAGAIAIGPSIAAGTADPVPPPPPQPPTVAPPPADPNPPPPWAVQPDEPELGRVDDVPDGFSYVVPDGWVESDASNLQYGSALLSKQTGRPMLPGQPTPVANDTRIVLGRLDQRLYASSEADSTKAATRLGSDMGEFFMPYPGTRFNQESLPLNGNGLTGSASYYEVRFSDPAKPAGQIWSGVIGTPPPPPANPRTPSPPGERWFVVWLGTANDPVDRGAAKVLAESIRPLLPPPPGEAPAAAPAPPPPFGFPPAPPAPAPQAPPFGLPQAPPPPAPQAPPFGLPQAPPPVPPAAA